MVCCSDLGAVHRADRTDFERGLGPDQELVIEGGGSQGFGQRGDAIGAY